MLLFEMKGVGKKTVNSFQAKVPCPAPLASSPAETLPTSTHLAKSTKESIRKRKEEAARGLGEGCVYENRADQPE